MKTSTNLQITLACLAGSLVGLHAAEPTVWLEGHGDLAINRIDNEWRFSVIIDAFPATEFAPDDAVIRLRDNARLEIPNMPDFSFLGSVGDPIWIAPQSQSAGVPHVGLSSEATPGGTFANNRFDVLLTSLTGPGGFVMWTTGGTGTPTVHLDSRGGFSAVDRFDLPSGGHNHMNWGFTEPGTYHLGLTARGTLTGTSKPTSSEEEMYAFEVGVLKSGEADIEVAYEDDALEFHVHDEVTDTELDPAHVALHAGPPSWQTVPNDPAFAFLGEAGDSLYIFPQDENEDALFLGLAGGEIAAGTFMDDVVQVRLTAFDGPGEFYYYEVDAFGSPRVQFNTADGLSGADVVALLAGSHAHRNWAFSAPGVYRVTLTASGELTAGGTVTSGPVTFLFEVFGPEFFDRGEIDLEIAFEDGRFELVLLNESIEKEFCATDAVLVGRAPATTTVPEDAAFNFLGAPGDVIHVLPQDEMENVLFLGLAADEIAPGLFAGEVVNLILTAVDGPGEVALYSVDGFGVPSVFMNSRDGVSAADAYPVAVGSHSHLNWAFSAAGEYRIVFKSAGTLVAGNTPTESETFTLSFLIEADGPTLTATLINGGTELQIGWDSESGVSYQLQSRTTLNVPGWTDEGSPIAGSGGPQTVIVPRTDDTLKVFQIVELP